MNDLFSSIFTKEDDGVIPDFISKVQEDEFLDTVVIEDQKVLKVLNQLKRSQSFGPDNCHPFFLKECATELYKPLSQIFKLSLKSGKIPRDWKKTNITCIFKKGDKSKPGN